MQIQLNEDEARVLRQALSSYLSDLRMEISNTDLKDYRDGLKRQKAVLTELLQQLERFAA